jgi:hypothetical protein
MDRRDRDETFRLDLVEAAKDSPRPHARIDQYDNGPRFEQRVRQRNEFNSGSHHEDDARSAGDTHVAKAAGEAVAQIVQLPEG